METTVVKGLKVLEALAVSHGPRTLTDLASQCGMSKSNAHRLLHTLEKCGYVRRASDERRYEASLRLWELGIRVSGRLDLRAVASSHLRDLAETTKETAHLSVFDGVEALYIDKADGTHAVRTYVNIGDRAPAYCSTSGKSMLAYQPEETVRKVAANLKRFTENTVTSLSQLRNHLELIRKQGYSVTTGEWRPGVLGLATAIKSPSGLVVGAIGVAGPEERMRQGDLAATIAAVVEAGRRIERDLGFGPTAASEEPAPVPQNRVPRVRKATAAAA
ncbi:MAG: IclR family transcriptional regulator [Rhizobiales bacterium]|nr:IclR family transcriptional regulator [Hyphomicrobiales bacterium]